MLIIWKNGQILAKNTTNQAFSFVAGAVSLVCYSGVRPCIAGPGVLFKTNVMENTTSIKELFDFFYLSEKQLTAGQVQSIDSVQKQFRRDKTLSEKQLAALREIVKYLPAQDTRFSGAEIM
ncbi:MAG: hypothetical protein IPJ16_13065 [Bacteroidales bacterium]|nr:hypothetical protein [Bacteroidales bacterium]